MAVCKHCGTEIEDGLIYCPNCGQSIEDNFGDFFEADEELEEEAYNIFDAPEEFDMDSLLSRNFEQDEPLVSRSEEASAAEPEIEEAEFVLPDPDPVTEDLFFAVPETEATTLEEPVFEEPVSQKTDDIAELLGLFNAEPEMEPEELPEIQPDVTDALTEIGESDIFALDELFEDLDTVAIEDIQEEAAPAGNEFEDLLAVGDLSEDVPSEDKKQKSKNADKEKKSFFQTVFGNVPIDPSKIKPEPDPEEIAAKKQKEAEEKQAKAEAKKLAAEEKKQIAQRNKEEKARQKALAKESKKARKLEEAKLILEEMKDTRINRLGATIVFLFFAVCAVAFLSGSSIFGYAISIHSAEDNFNKAYNKNVKYYTDAYNDIYGLEIKPEDQLLSDKIMTVMFVNKELNSYNSHMILKDYPAALHSLLLGLYRYGKYYEQAIPLGIDRDMDYVRTQILKELEATFDVSEDEAELLRSMLESAGAGGMNAVINPDAAREYNLALYEIVMESGLENDSNN